MSETYVVAARLRLSKKAVTSWLRDGDPVTLTGLPDPLGGPLPHVRSVRHGLASLADAAAASSGVFHAAWNGSKRAFTFYSVHVGFQREAILTALSAVVAACRHGLKDDWCAVVAETSGALWEPGALVAVHLGATAEVRPITAHILSALAPAEAAYRAMLEADPVGSMLEPAFLHPQIRQLAKHPSLKKNKHVVPTYEDAEAWLAAVRSVALLKADARPTHDLQYTSYPQFERDIIVFARQVPQWGVALRPALEQLLQGEDWEPGVIAFWALNQLSLATDDPSHYLRALELLRTWKHGHNGWVRGETTNEDIAAQDEHRRALAGTPLEGASPRRAIWQVDF